MNSEEKISMLNGLFDEFHSKISDLLKKQSKLIKRSIRLGDEKKLSDVRDKIKKG